MTKFTTAEVKACALALLEKKPKGMRWTELFKAVAAAGPETPPGTIQGSLRNLRVNDKEIVLPTKGLWVLAKYADVPKSLDVNETASSLDTPSKSAPSKFAETAFYQPLADWLRDEAEEVVEALTLGGSAFKSKWGTPDVIGVNKQRKSDPVQFLPTEIVAAEIKVDSGQAVTAFGQACAYRLFAHKSYVVMPKSLSEEDRDRMDALCGLFGIGFIEFAVNPAAPNFAMRVRAQRFEPERFYVNAIAEVLRNLSPKDFDRLF